MTRTRQDLSYRLLCACVALLGAAIFAYSQTRYAFSWDEGFHLLTAQLIEKGERPYLDFFFPQTPLNAYWDAWWMWVFGDSYRVAHGAAALCTTSAILLTADFVYTRFVVPGWQFAAALTLVILVGLNESLVEYGVVGQAYGFALFLSVAAFRVALAAVPRSSPLLAGLAGCLAGAAAASTLLTAPLLPVLLIWIGFYSVTGNRWAKIAAYLAGAGIPFLPVFLLAAQNIRVVLFNIYEYHAFHRQEEWDDAIPHDLEILSSWVDTGQALLLIVLGIAGLWYVRKRSAWSRAQKGEFYLCAWITLAITAHLMNAHPTFARYWLFTVPFLGSLAAVGLYAISYKLYESTSPRPFLPIACVLLLVSLGEARSIRGQKDNTTWKNHEDMAAKVAQVVKPGGVLLAPEQIYFLLKRQPPVGFEHADSHKLKQSPEFSKQLHVVPIAEMERMVQSGAFDAVESCDDDEKRERWKLPSTYKQTFDVGDCRLYWDKKK